MASGQTLNTFTAQAGFPPATNFATLDTRNTVPVLDYDDTTDETAYFVDVLPRHYAGGGITVTIGWMASSATTGAVNWEVAFERHVDDGDDMDSDGFAATKNASETTSSASGEVKYTEIAFTHGAEIDSIAVGEFFRLLVRRDANGTTGTDDAAGDAELVSVELRET